MKNRIFILVLGCVLSVSAWSESRNYSVEIRGADMRDVLRMLAQLDGKNVVIPDQIEAKVTASFESATLSDALASILTAHGLGSSVENNIVRVTTLEKIKEQGNDLVTQIIYLRYSNTKSILPQVSALVSERGSAIADERTNAITIRDTQMHVGHIQKFIEKVDIQDRRVLIEAKIIEASKDFVLRLGIQWGVTTGAGSNPSVSGVAAVGTANSGRTLNVGTPVTGKTTLAPAAGGVLVGSIAGATIDAQITAAEEHGEVNILSRPSISTMNNQPAEIHSGTKFYVKTTGDVNIGTTAGTGIGGSQGLQQIDAGITLKVIPQITIDDHINMAIDVIESQPDFTKAIDGIPAILANTAATRVMLKDGEMTVIGGLMQNRTEELRRGLPGLMNIPIVGGLFGSTGKGETNTELLIFIRPSIVRDQLTELPKKW